MHTTTDYVCYVLRQPEGRRTYCGATNNLSRRLRQHNAEIRGGARYTTRHRKAGGRWSVHFVVRGFESPRDCLRFEWRLKRVRTPKGLRPCQRRDHALRVLRGVWPYELEVSHAA